MKIAYLGIKGLPSKGGTERVVEAIVTRLAGKHEITVYCDTQYTPAGTVFPGVKLIRIASVPGKYAHPTVLFLLQALHALFFGNYDLIHMHGVDASFTLPLLRLRYKVVSTSHGSWSRVRREKWRKVIQQFLANEEYLFCGLSHIVTSVSAGDAEFYKERYHKDVVYVPNGVDQNIPFNLEAARALIEPLGVEPGKYMMFAAGRIDPSKGCHLAIEALKEIESEVPLLVVGNLGEVESYAKELRQMAVGRPIHFIPLITDKALLFGLVKQCKLFVFPSICEGMSIMMLEVASLGVPMVCSDIAENKAALRENAMYFKSEDVKDIAEKIQWALDHYPEAEEIACRAQSNLGQTLTWDNVTDHYERLYQQCLEGEAQKPSLANES